MSQYDEKTEQILLDLCDSIYVDRDASYYLKQIARLARTELVRERTEAYINTHQPQPGDDA